MRPIGRPGGPGQQRRSRGMFIVTPIMLAALVLVGMVTVIVHDEHRVAPAAATRPLRPADTTTAPPTTSTTTTPSPVPTTTTTAAPPPNPVSPAMVTAAVAAVDALDTRSVTYGAAVLDRDTGQLVTGQNGATRFYSASVVKLFVVVDLLHQQEAGAITLSAAAQTDIQRALELSDDNAMDELWEDYDGPAAVNGMITLAHLQDTVLPSDISQWGETLISARDVLAVYQYALTGLSAADSSLVVGDLGQAADTGADGFDQAFGLLAPTRDATVKAKQGWMSYGEQLMLHTTGLLGAQNRFVIAVLSLQPTDIGWAAGRANVTAATGALLAALGPAAAN